MKITTVVEVTLTLPTHVEDMLRSAVDLAIGMGAEAALANPEYLRGQVELIANTWGPNSNRFHPDDIASIAVDQDGWKDAVRKAVLDTATHLRHP